jgi:hypothetical protein
LGRQYFLRLKNQLSKRSLDHLLTSSTGTNAQRNFTRILGFGGRWTHVSNMAISDYKKLDELSYIGALSNLIVSIFDDHLDNQNNIILTKEQLINCIKDNNTNDQSLELNDSFIELVTLFFRLLKELSHNKEALDYCYLIIGRMYTAQMDKDASPTKKSYLPFVLMGILGGILKPIENWVKIKKPHIKWLIHIGLFWSLIDDIVDFEDDAIAGRRNVLLNDFRPIDQLEKNILYHNKGMLNPYHAITDELQEIISTTLISWFGGKQIVLESVERVS